jgi:MFS family permease
MTLATGVRILERRSPAVRPGLLVIAVCLGGAMVGLDGSAITIAAPSIARSTHASLGDLTVIANVYLVMLAVCILPAGRLADRLGRRAGFIVGALGFAACSEDRARLPGCCSRRRLRCSAPASHASASARCSASGGR